MKYYNSNSSISKVQAGPFDKYNMLKHTQRQMEVATIANPPSTEMPHRNQSARFYSNCIDIDCTDLKFIEQLAKVIHVIELQRNGQREAPTPIIIIIIRSTVTGLGYHNAHAL